MVLYALNDLIPISILILHWLFGLNDSKWLAIDDIVLH